MNKKIKLPLFWKFTIAIVFVVLLFGSINLYFINYALFDLTNKEINRHGISTAKVIVERSIDPILYNDIPYLNKIVSDNIEIDPSIAYIIIYDKSNKILTHTFENNVPFHLRNINIINGKLVNFIKVADKNNPKNIIRNMTVPILNGNLGNVQIGIYEENFNNSITTINNFFLAMVALFLLFGIVVASVFAYIITAPIKRISKVSENLKLNEKDFEMIYFNQETKNRLFNFKTTFLITDEIDVLSAKFDEMLRRLQKTYTDLQNSQEGLMQSEKITAIGTLSAGLAHEINNPIAGIQNCLKRIANNPNNMEQNATYIELMSEAIEKIKLVVGGLLNFSRKHQLVFTQVNLQAIIEDVLVLTAYQFEESQITIAKNYQENLPLINGSNNHIEQVVLNLIINAIDAINERKIDNFDIKGEVRIYLYQETEFLRLKIIDNGKGILTEKIKNIFDPFFTMKKIKQGTGLGLSVSYNIMSLHKGTIKVKNNDNFGACFTISFPLVK